MDLLTHFFIPRISLMEEKIESVAGNGIASNGIAGDGIANVAGNVIASDGTAANGIAGDGMCLLSPAWFGAER
jgi:hypothetical protein